MSSQIQSLYYRERAIALAKAGLNVRAFRGAATLASYGVVKFSTTRKRQERVA
jgi:hypothetical protein